MADLGLTTTKLGQMAYEAYNNAGTRQWLTWDGKPVPTWGNLTMDIQNKWIAAAVAVNSVGK